MNYTLREIECFTAVAETLSFTRAAQNLHLAQPPLSRHVRTLEEKLGTRLFERSGRRVALTPAGAVFFEETRGVLPRLLRAGEATRRFALGQTERLRLGFVSAVLGPELVGVLRAFREAHPKVQLAMRDAPPAEQLAALRRGELEGGFVGLAPREPAAGVRFVRWHREPLMAFVPFGHPLAARTPIDLKDLAGEPMLAVSREAAPAFAAFVSDACATAGFRPRLAFEADRAQAVATLVAAGMGVALLPASLARFVGEAAAALPLRRAPAITHVFALNAGSPPPALKALVALLRT
jgi:DNA-binding transcriptional LysR family regulator